MPTSVLPNLQSFHNAHRNHQHLRQHLLVTHPFSSRNEMDRLLLPRRAQDLPHLATRLHLRLQLPNPIVRPF